MITVTGLTKAYGLQTLFENSSFAVGAGERVGLVGRNGSGKTTLFRLILKEEEPDGGAIHVPKNYPIGFLSQHISFRHDTVLKEACIGLKTDDDGVDRTYIAKEILSGLGFSLVDFSRRPEELSGGYQIRLNLARLLISEPRMLLLDEPTNYLDILSVRWLTRFLRGWKREFILITHDRDFMDSVTTHTMAIHRTSFRKMEGSTHKLYQQILQEEEVYEQTRINDEKKRKEIEQFVNKFRAQATKARAVQSRIKALEKKEKLQKMTGERNLEFEFSSAPFHGKWLLEGRELSFSFTPSRIPLISGLTFSIGKKDRIGIIGKNGKGKTTLLRLLAGELGPLSGSIVRHDHVEVGYFGQTNIDRLNPENTVEEEIGSVFHDGGYNTVRNICGAMMFDGDRALKKVGVLSGGERSRVMLGKILASSANLLLLDEPTNHLDMESIDSLVEALETFKGAVLIATHSEMILQILATKLIVFDRGTVTLFDGSYQDFLDRVGWESEDLNRKDRGEGKPGRERALDRKEFKRLKADIIANRSRALTPLNEHITRLEGRIIALEKQMEEENAILIRASENNDGKLIAQTSMSIHNKKREIDLAFQELETYSSEHYEKMREFEDKLEDLDRLDKSATLPTRLADRSP
ncbi:MAG: ATP-binding cassette domain-containing protein [Syntrophobacterales bacterium]|jgi:ATP-binding cassette subfamily F protein 3|nr:ATP-binding cassette domain-containing protein [Syntrophobacterales bacterium]